MRTIILSLLLPVALFGQEITLSTSYHAHVDASLRLQLPSVGFAASVGVLTFGSPEDQIRLTAGYFTGSNSQLQSLRTLDRGEVSAEAIYSLVSGSRWFVVGQIGFEVSQTRMLSQGLTLSNRSDDWFGAAGIGFQITAPVAITARYLGGRGNEGIRIAVEYGL